VFRYLVTIFSYFLLSLAFIGGGAITIFYYFGIGLPNYQHLTHYKPDVVTRLYAQDGRMFAEYAYEKRLFVPLEAIPKLVIKAFLSAEDKNFYHHSGIDIPSILSAAVHNITHAAFSKRPYGASTITQQVAKNFLLTEIANQVSYERKIKEAILAFRLENAYSKDHILEIYLNQIYLGKSSYGIAAAAVNYFNKNLSELSLAEVAFLAALPKAPNNYNPQRNPDAAKVRRDYVIQRMLEDKHILEEEAQKAKLEPLTIASRENLDTVYANYFAEEVRRELVEKFGDKALYKDGLVVRTSLNVEYQKMAREVLKEGLIAYDKRHGWRGPITNLSLTDSERIPSKSVLNDKPASWVQKLQTISASPGHGHWLLAVVLELKAEYALIGFTDGTLGRIPLSELKWARRYINENSLGPIIAYPKDVLKLSDVILVDRVPNTEKGAKSNFFKLCQIPAVSGGIIAMDPHSGRVLALQGGYSFKISQFNRATQALRQIGSTIKPFVYLAGIEKGLHGSMSVKDVPFSINLGKNLGIWRPRNYDEKFMGHLSLRRAFELSRNAVTIHLTHDVIGIKNVINIAQRFNITDKMPAQLAMALGASETTLLRLTAAYGMIANGGKKIVPTLLDRVQDRYGKTILTNKLVQCNGCDNKLALGFEIPTVENEFPLVTDPASAYQMVSLLQGVTERGTAKILLELKRPIAGKTGTTNEFRNAWFVGFTPDLVVGIYVGFDSHATLGLHENGARVAAPIFLEFMKRALKNKAAMPFRVPPGVKLVRVDVSTGQPAQGNGENIIHEAFKSETDLSNFEGRENNPQEPRSSSQNIVESKTDGLY
jgi:penicillin-binding protein 1A